MDQYIVCGRYNFWRGVWQVSQSNVPGLLVEQPIHSEFLTEVTQACRKRAGGRDHQITVTTKPKSCWTIEPPFGNHVIMNGKIVTRKQMRQMKARFQAAG